MTIKEVVEILNRYNNNEEVITMCEAQSYTKDSKLFAKFGLTLEDNTPSVIGGILQLGLVIVHPSSI